MIDDNLEATERELLSDFHEDLGGILYDDDGFELYATITRDFTMHGPSGMATTAESRVTELELVTENAKWTIEKEEPL